MNYPCWSYFIGFSIPSDDEDSEDFRHHILVDGDISYLLSKTGGCLQNKCLHHQSTSSYSSVLWLALNLVINNLNKYMYIIMILANTQNDFFEIEIFRIKYMFQQIRKQMYCILSLFWFLSLPPSLQYIKIKIYTNPLELTSLA